MSVRVERYVSGDGYGQSWTLVVSGKHRARWATTGSLTPMWPHVYRGADQDCNRSVSLHLWPIGGLDVWWETKWRPAGSGICDACVAESEEMTQ